MVGLQEIEEQEKMLKEKAVTTDISDLNSALELEWRKRSDSALLETMLSHVDSLQTSNNSGRLLRIVFLLKVIVQSAILIILSFW